MPIKKILTHLAAKGEQFDSEIALATGIPLSQMQHYLSELTETGQIMSCQTIKYEKGRRIEGITCRLVGVTPRITPGRKAKGQVST